jgi:hypothetical protein
MRNKWGNGVRFADAGLVLTYTHAVNMLNATALAARMRAQDARARARASVIVIGAGFHLLQLWPAREFESAEAALACGEYEAGVARAIDTAQRHVGADGLVVWKHVNDICDARYEDDYAKPLAFGARASVASPPTVSWAGHPNNHMCCRSYSRAECDAYVRNATEAPLGCAATQLAHSGAAALVGRAEQALHRAAVDVAVEERSLNGRRAEIAVLESYTITTGQCWATARKDGRHYAPLVLSELLVLAEGIARRWGRVP